MRKETQENIDRIFHKELSEVEEHIRKFLDNWTTDKKNWKSRYNQLIELYAYTMIKNLTHRYEWIAFSLDLNKRINELVSKIDEIHKEKIKKN